MPIKESNRITPQNKYAANSGDVDNLNYIKDTYTTQSAQNSKRYPQEYRTILAYPEGYAMQVTYFHRNHPNIDTRSMSSELIDKDDAVHKDLTRILNLEMKLTEPLQSEFREEDNTFLISGQAVMYPGLEPYIGDLFYLEIDNNNIHLFRVNNITPTTYRQERNYAISFSTYTKVNEEVYRRLNSTSLTTMVFDKKSYFGSSEYSLLTYDSYFVLTKLRSLRKSISQDLINFFFDSSVQSFIRPDKVYDPYVVEYLKRKISVFDDGVRAVQLYPRLNNYNRSIWYKLIDSNNTLDLSDLYYRWSIRFKAVDMFDSDINGLMEMNYLILTEDAKKSKSINTGVKAPEINNDNSYKPIVNVKRPLCSYKEGSTPAQEATYDDTVYIFSLGFYKGFVEETNTLEKCIFNWLSSNILDPKEIVLLTERYRKFGFDTNEAFYTYCLYLSLIDAAIIRVAE